DGTRIAGVPTTPGDYVIVVKITDATGAAAVVTAGQPLHVNAALTLPSVFGVRANSAVDVDVASGGTDATWTIVTNPPTDSGLTLSTSGHALHLTGTTAG